ncbi:CU044_5270 family protein [Saccharothrix luteola]|uniref:CU044_5270 family protein n=1 Tax=Saccharothrix luteola TaxID=2893018 RepID=UPI001E324C31|nr:CU044_5270 family protein [Saccharothrix luteola]MCC8250702.1 CU044_5270 family protein [Saccharothrix luteola]
MSDDHIRRVWTEDELDSALDALNADVRADEPVLAAARAELISTIEQGETDVTTTRERAPRRSARRWLAGAAAVGVLVAGALLAQTVSFGGPAPATAEAVQALDRAAAQAIGAVDEPVGPGRYRYVATHAWWMGSASPEGKEFAWLAEHVQETWTPQDPRDEWLLRQDQTGGRQWVIGTEEEAKAIGLRTGSRWPEGEWRAACGDFFGESNCEEPGSWQRPTAQWQASLPTDPAALYERLRADAPANDRGDAALLTYAADALRSGLIGKDLRAALYQALTRLPGLEVTEQQANLSGRVGIALGVDDGDRRHDIIIDPETGLFIGERQVVTAWFDEFDSGTVVSFTSVTTGVVDAIGVQPAG